MHDMHFVMKMAFVDSSKYVCILKVRLEVHTSYGSNLRNIS